MSTTQVTGPIDIYARLSRKGDKEQRSTSGQAGACRAVLAERELAEGLVHVDDGRSAWNPRVHREGWDALMARLETGAAAGVIVFDLERFSRQPAEGERLIAAAERGLLVLDSRSEEHTSELSHVEISYAVFCLKKKITNSVALTVKTIQKYLDITQN